MSNLMAQQMLARKLEVWDCEIRRRPDGPGTLNTSTLEVVPKSPVTVWSGKAGFGARRSGQRRDGAYADRRENVGILRVDARDGDIDSAAIDDEVEWSSGPLSGETWYVIGLLESAWRGTKRILISTVKQEVAQS